MQLSLTFTILFGIGQTISSETSVQTNIGTIIGTTKEVNVFGESKYVENYFGIPYAEPPVGNLRFRNAVPKRKLTTPLDASKHGKPCYEMNLLSNWKGVGERSEDCLFLNVYVPANTTGGLAVMVYIHGGALVHGASNYYVSDTLAVFGNVIVVTINYRVSIFGFLSTDDIFARGNYAFSDQHLAIKWVHENIQAFGGDPNRITLVGQSAGGNSISIQSLYEGNVGLFKRAILQSGAGIPRPFEFNFAKPKEDARKLGKLVGCRNTESSKLLIDCLRAVSADDLYKTLNNVSNGFFDNYPLPFLFHHDGTFTKSKYRDLVGAANTAGRDLFASIDVMVGFNSHEGCLFVGPVASVEGEPDNFTPNRTFYENTLVPRALELTFNKKASKRLRDLILQVYTNWGNPKDAFLVRENFVNLYTDIIFAETSLDYVKNHHRLSSANNTYLYEYDVLRNAILFPSPSWCTKGTHGDEMHFQFFEEANGLTNLMDGFGDYVSEDWERDLAKIIMTLWTNFAKTGYVLCFFFCHVSVFVCVCCLGLLFEA